VSKISEPHRRLVLPALLRTRAPRLAASLASATLFFAGAALAPGAGNALVDATPPDTTTGATTTEPIPPQKKPFAPVPEEPAADESAPEEPATAAPAPEQPPAEEAPGAVEPVGSGEPPAEPAPVPATDPAAPSGAPAGTAPAPGAEIAVPLDTAGSEPDEKRAAPVPEAGGGRDGRVPAAPPSFTPRHRHDGEATRDIDREADTAGAFASLWLHRTLPDPTPPAKRLARAFARVLRVEAKRAGVQWSTLLGALRADGHDGRNPAGRSRLRGLANRLAAQKDGGERHAFLALRGRTAYADRAQALARYNRAVGLRGLVIGLAASKERLIDLVLDDPRLDIYGGGRADIASGKTDVRILALLRYLAEAHAQVTVSSLTTGHRLYARPGVISAHVYGLAVDIAALAGQSILRNSQPGGVMEQGVRNILLLPAELRPRQLISLLGLGGPSFPMTDHHDHIHVGY
jgi:hypothetical protein